MDDDKREIEPESGSVVYGLSDSQRDAVRQFIQEWRRRAVPVGPLHSLWEDIMEAEDLLAGRPVQLLSDELLTIVRSPNEDAND